MYKVSVRMVDYEQFMLDCEKSRRLVDELCAAAFGVTTGGPMGYTAFIDARHDFKQHIENLIKSYKVVELQ